MTKKHPIQNNFERFANLYRNFPEYKKDKNDVHKIQIIHPKNHPEKCHEKTVFSEGFRIGKFFKIL